MVSVINFGDRFKIFRFIKKVTKLSPVNTGLGVASIVMILSVMFTTWEGFRMLKNEKTEESLELEEK